ncbi:TonB-dependent copper receptor [Luteimonas weifangensis]|uniref:TonB-dependent copper receptor n=1 Tax=Cognatiluteimonas weifangensis TaxID=2303539 RepID=A0A372DLG8_9GAMM|nr:TonB-dependent copper receptor [Luteimonas weifangensis]
MPRASCLAASVAAALLLSCSVSAAEPRADEPRADNPRANEPRADQPAEAPQSEVPVLDAVVVTAVRPSSALTFETDPKLPRQPVPASDGADYLKTIPGFGAIRNGGSNADPVLRGMFGSRLNLLSNDGAMPGACPSRMDNPLSYVSPENYDRLVVVKGPQTVLWGPGASAGTVRFERERRHFQSRELQLGGSLLGGSAGRNDQVLDATHGAPSGYARLNANRSHADDYEDGDGRTVASAWNKWNSDLALGWTPDAHTVLELSAGFGDGEARYAGRSMDGAQFVRESYTLHFAHERPEGRLGAIEASVYRNLADHVMDNYSLRQPNPAGPMPMPMASNVERLTSGGRVAARWRGDGFEATAGLDAQDSRHRQRKAPGREAYRAQAWATDARFDDVGAFGEVAWRAGGRDRLVAGARVDRASATDARVTVGRMPTPNPTAGVTRHETLGAGFLRWERVPGEGALGGYIGLGRSERMPDYWELFSADRGPAGAANAFAGLDTEKTTQLDLGLEYRSRRVAVWVTAYAGRIDDYILFTYQSGGMRPTTSVAGVDADIHGGELGIELRPADHWLLGGTLAYAWGAQRDNGLALPQMPPLEARLSLGREGERWSFGTLLRAVAAQERIVLDQGNVVGRDLGPSAGFATFAVNGGYRFGDRLQLTAGIDNLFDRGYSEHLNLAGNADFGYPADPVRIGEPGRTVWMKFNLTY